MPLLLVRHGETEWSRVHRHTSVTDLPLTNAGEEAARALAASVHGHHPVAAWVSPRQRARRTAELAAITTPVEAGGLGLDAVIEPDLVEWDYGEVEGITTLQFRADHPHWPEWSVWDGPVPGGEDAASVGARCDAVLARVDAAVDLHRDNAVLVAHGHVLRVLAARWLGLAPDAGRLLRLDTSTLSVLGHERTQRVVLAWNVPA